MGNKIDRNGIYIVNDYIFSRVIQMSIDRIKGLDLCKDEDIEEACYVNYDIRDSIFTSIRDYHHNDINVRYKIGLMRLLKREFFQNVNDKNIFHLISKRIIKVIKKYNESKIKEASSLILLDLIKYLNVKNYKNFYEKQKLNLERMFIDEDYPNE